MNFIRLLSPSRGMHGDIKPYLQYIRYSNAVIYYSGAKDRFPLNWYPNINFGSMIGVVD